MATFSYGGGDPIEVDPENEAQYDAAGWSRVDEVPEPKQVKAPKDGELTQ